MTSRLIQFEKIHPNAKIPVRKTKGAAALDISVLRTTVPARTTMVVPTGLRVSYFAPGHHALLMARSSTHLACRFQIMIGLIDNDYRGELGVIVTNPTDQDMDLPSARYAQLIIHHTPKDMDGEVERTGGFGSTNDGDE